MSHVRNFHLHRVFLLLIAFFLVASTADALFLIQGDQDGQAGITIKLVDTDDADDPDQTVTDPDKAIVQVENRLRRYVGVYILRNANSSSEYVVDNGQNDNLIDPASELVSSGTFQDFADWAFGLGGKATLAPASRRYILPIARGQSDQVAPGVENRFDVRVVGPSPASFPYGDDTATAQEELAVDAALWTGGFLFVIPVLDLIVPGLKKNAQLCRDILPEIVNALKQSPSLAACFSQEDSWACTEAQVKKLLESHLLPDLLRSEAVQQELQTFVSKEKLNSLANTWDFARDILLTPATAADVVNVVLQLQFAPWEEMFEISIVRPKVGAIEPKVGSVGDEVTISGAGFDTYNTSNNQVLFADVTGVTREARVISVPAEDTIVVEVPDGDLQGPVVVCDTALLGILVECCSNDDVNFGGSAATTLSITSPEDGARVEGFTDIVVEVKDMPGDAFDYGKLVAELFIDGVKQTDKYVDSSSFSFLNVNVGTLTDGRHTVEVRLAITGSTISHSIEVVVPAADADFPRSYCGSLRAGTTDLSETRPVEILLVDLEDEVVSDVQYYTLVLTCKFKLKKGPQFEDTEEEMYYSGQYNRKEFDLSGVTFEGRWSVTFETIDFDNETGSGYYDDAELFGSAGGRYRDERFYFVDVTRCGTD